MSIAINHGSTSIRNSGPYIDILYISTLEHINIFNKAIAGLPENDKYDLTISKWTEFYQEFDDAVSTFVFKDAVLSVTARDGAYISIKVKNIMLS